jgi:hypothetical protein
MPTATPHNTQLEYQLSTEEFGNANRVKGQTVRKRYCETGSYYGVTPLKLANRRLAWPNVQVAAK